MKRISATIGAAVALGLLSGPASADTRSGPTTVLGDSGSSPDCPAPQHLTFYLHPSPNGRIVGARVYLDGKLLATLRAPRGKALSRITVTHLPTTGTHQLKIVTRASHGAGPITVRKLSGCPGEGQPKTGR